MARIGPVSLKQLLGSPPKPKVVVSKTGEVLVGDEVDDLMEGDGLHAAAPTGYGRPKSKLGRMKHPKRRGQLVQVVPQVMGQDSLTYGTDGKAIKKKPRTRGKRRKKNQRPKNGFFGKGMPGRTQSPEPVKASTLQFHLGRKDTVDGAKGWAVYRDKNRFGSFSIHDPHGDESGPE
jgi:hypothetical protein